jgi:RNA ligase
MNEILNKYHEDNLVYKQVHPTLPLTIWNYSEKVQYDNLWDDITLQTRGLVTDDKGNIIARPFKKFFNDSEKKHTPTPDFDVYEKMDGSLGILFYYEKELSYKERYKIWFSSNYETGFEYNEDVIPDFDNPYYEPTPKTKGEWVLATRGSFTSDQAVKGFEMLQKYEYQKLHKDYTYLFEIIYKENRIVVQYPYEDLILLGMINTKTGYEVDLYGEGNDVRLKNLVSNLGFKVVRKYDGINDYSILKGMIKDDEEGFVVKFSNGDRMKVKGEEYLRLHKIMTNISTTAVWEMLSEGRDVLEIIKDVPDEFYKKVKSYVDDLNYNYYRYNEYAGKIHEYFRYGKYGDRDPEPSKKDFALHLEKSEVHPKVKAICFAMWDRKNYDKMIWSYIKPEFRKL